MARRMFSGVVGMAVARIAHVAVVAVVALAPALAAHAVVAPGDTARPTRQMVMPVIPR